MLVRIMKDSIDPHNYCKKDSIDKNLTTSISLKEKNLKFV